MPKFLSGLLILIVLNLPAISQVSFEHSDYPETGSSYPVISFSDSVSFSPVDINLFKSGSEWIFDSTYNFNNSSIDTLRYLNPANYDTAGLYNTATHLLRTPMQDLYIYKNNQKAEVLGISGDIFGAGIDLSVKGEDPLKIMEFPTNAFTSFTDDTYGERAMAIEELEGILPDSIYDQMYPYVDSVKIMLTLTTDNEIIALDSVSVDLDETKNETHLCLQEYNISTTEANIHVYTMLGWMPLSDVSGIDDMIPFDLPYTDTSYYYNFWTPEYGRPFAQMSINESQDSVLSLTFLHESASGVFANNYDTEINLYPNPAKETVKIKIPDETEIYKMIIISSDGKIISERKIINTTTKLSVNKLPSGIYNVAFYDKNNIFVAAKKLSIAQ